MARLVIEHLEPTVSPWAYLEYKHAAEFAEELLITNVKDPIERQCLKPFAEVLECGIEEVADLQRILVLDPLAAKPLVPSDFESFEYIVVGGIMGDFPPRGRTRKLLTEKLNGESRTLGPCQLSVDGAIYVASRVAEGDELSLIEVVMGLTLKGERMEMHLPYCYPLAPHGVLFSEELAAYLLTLIEVDEAYAARTGRLKSIADYGCRLKLPKVRYEIIAGKIVRIGEVLSKPFIPEACKRSDERV